MRNSFVVVVAVLLSLMARSGTVYDLKLAPELLEKAFQNTVWLLRCNVQVSD
jgi:hypothetical protein